MPSLFDLIRQSLRSTSAEKPSRPLLYPLGRAADEDIDAALRDCGLRRADLFKPETSLAPHRQRTAAMIAMQGLDAESLAGDFWPLLKDIDHRCAHCENTRRCERWLKWGRANDAPEMFCPNADSFESLRAKTRQ